MTYITWLIRLLVFGALLGFAFMNSDVVKLRYWFSYEWNAPLVLILVAFLAVGVVVGLLAALGTIFRLRRQIQGLKKELKLQAGTQPTATPAVAPPAAALPERPGV